MYSYLYNLLKSHQKSKTADDILLIVQPLDILTTTGRQQALTQFDEILKVFQGEITADTSVNIGTVMGFSELLLQKLSNCDDEFFEKYDSWQRRTSTITETIEIF